MSIGPEYSLSFDRTHMQGAAGILLGFLRVQTFRLVSMAASGVGSHDGTWWPRPTGLHANEYDSLNFVHPQLPLGYCTKIGFE